MTEQLRKFIKVLDELADADKDRFVTIRVLIQALKNVAEAIEET